MSAAELLAIAGCPHALFSTLHSHCVAACLECRAMRSPLTRPAGMHVDGLQPAMRACAACLTPLTVHDLTSVSQDMSGMILESMRAERRRAEAREQGLGADARAV